MWQSAQDFIYVHLNAIIMGIALSPIWASLSSSSSSFFTSTSTSIIVSLWFLDLLSRWVAKYLSPTERISIKASEHSLVNLFMWLIVMATCYCFRVFGAFWIALPIESASIMILGASVLKNIAQHSDYPLLQKVADQFTHEIEVRISAPMTTTVTVAPNQPPAPPTITVTQEPTPLPTVATPKESINEGAQATE